MNKFVNVFTRIVTVRNILERFYPKLNDLVGLEGFNLDFTGELYNERLRFISFYMHGKWKLFKQKTLERINYILKKLDNMYYL